ncbi:MAG TPA: endolytic transglycosylase MltG [Acidimicrobiia bacterium]
MSDHRREFDDRDPPDRVDGGGAVPGRVAPARPVAPPRRSSPRQGSVPPPSPPDPRFWPDRSRPPGATDQPPRRRRPEPRHAPDADELDAHDVPGGGVGVATAVGGDALDTRAGRRAAERAARAQRKRHRRRSVAALLIVGVLVLPFLVAAGWFVYQLNPPGGPGATVRIEIEEGWGISEIADELESKGVIGSALAFELYAKARSAGPFRDGPYELRTSLGVRDAVSELEAGPVRGGAADLELVLAPGLTLEQIAQRVGELPGRDAATFLQLAQSGQVRSRYQPTGVSSLEGMLFPDTYRIANQDGSEEDELAILQRLVAEFDERAAAAGIDAAPTVIGRTPYEAIVIGSLIEREAGVDQDRPLISAVIANRLRDGELLQIDAANCYGKPGGCADAPLTDADKQSDSPYNTYRFPGLVPTPISSVGEASLQAALAPAAVPYKFYVIADESGAHAFAETLDQHNANVAEAQRKGLL